MMKIRLFGALIASAALAACGGGGEDAGGDASETADTMENAAQETSAEDASAGEDMAADEASGGDSDAASGGEGMAEEAEAAADDMAGMADDAMDSAEEMAGDAAEAMDGAMEDAAQAAEDAAGSSDDGGFTVAGLTGDPEAGRRVFARCRSCHVLEEGVNRVGPSLYGIFGRETGSVEGFRYSDANANAGVTWTKDTMFEYLENPREYIPGTIMSFPGLRDPQDRADVIAYMKQNGGDPDAG